jgi:hypothetical protein
MSGKLFFMLLVAVFLSLQASASGQIQKINGSTTSNHSPKISGDYVAWRGDDGGAGIFLYDGSTVSQIGQPVEGLPYLDWVSSIDGGKVAWTGLSGLWTSREVLFYDGSTTTRLTNNGDGDQNPRVSGNNVVWDTLIPNRGGQAVYRYDGISVQRLTDPGEKGWTPDIDGNSIVWEGDSGIVLYDGTTKTTLPNSFTGNYPRISGNNVVWISNDAANSYVSYYDGTTTKVIGTHPVAGVLQLPLASGDIAGWLGYDGHDWEVFYYDGIQTIQVTDNEENEEGLAISGEFAVWVGGTEYDREVYAFDFSSQTTFKITNNEVREEDLDVSGDVVVWVAGGDVWMTTIPEPGTLSLLAIAGLALIRHGRR